MAQAINIAGTAFVSQFLTARRYSEDDAKRARKAVWSTIRSQYGIPESVKLKVELDHNNNGDQYVLKDKATNTPLYAENGRFVSVGSPILAQTAQPARQAAQDGQDVVRVISSSDQPKYIRVGVSNLSQLADDYPIDLEDDGVEVIHMSDVGRVAYDKDADAILIRLG